MIRNIAPTNFQKVIHFQKKVGDKFIPQQFTINIRKGERIPRSKELFDLVKRTNGNNFRGFCIDTRLNNPRYSLDELLELLIINWDMALRKDDFELFNDDEFKAFKALQHEIRSIAEDTAISERNRYKKHIESKRAPLKKILNSGIKKADLVALVEPFLTDKPDEIKKKWDDKMKLLLKEKNIKEQVLEWLDKVLEYDTKVMI